MASPRTTRSRTIGSTFVAPKKLPKSRSESIGQLLVCLLALRDVTTKRRGLLRLLVEPRHLWRRYLLDNLLFLFRVLKQRVLPKMGRRAGTGADTLVRVMRGYTSCRSLRWSV